MAILLMLSVIFFIAETILIWKVAKNKKEKSKQIFAVSGILAMIQIILGILEMTGVISAERFENSFLLIGISSVIEWIMGYSDNKEPFSLLRFLGKTVFVTVMLELTVFQFPSYWLMAGSGYDEATLSFSDATIRYEDNVPEEVKKDEPTYHIDDNGSLVISDKYEVIIEFEDLNKKVGTIAVNADFINDTKRTNFIVDITDETHIDYRYGIMKTDIVKNHKNSGYAACSFSGNIGKMRVRFKNYEASDEVILSDLRINSHIPFYISFIRVVCIIILAELAFAVIKLDILKESFEKRYDVCRTMFIAATGVGCVLALSVMTVKLGGSTVEEHLHLETGNQVTKELVDAFESGSVSLLIEPTKELLELENPYDWSMRGINEVTYEWDHVFYNGKYYSYYGIAPVVLFFIPYHLMTGYYFSTTLAVGIFSTLGLIFLTLVYTKLLKKFFASVPAGLAIAGHIILLCSCGIWFSLGRPEFYELSISSGFMFITLGTYFLLSSNVVGEGNISLVKTMFASLFMALAVLSRPTLATYCVCSCIYFTYGFLKIGGSSDKLPEGKKLSSRKAAYLICAVLPLVLLGSFQMWYNYVRFGSPLDFGIQYSLTINDFTRSQYHTSFVLIAIMNYLFAVPSFSMDYPYITTPFSTLDTNGYFFVDKGNTSGVIFLALPVFSYLFAKKALSLLPGKKDKIKKLLLIGLPCVVMPVVIIVSVWESGYAVRYTADISWPIILGAYTVMFWLYKNIKNETKKTFVTHFMAFSMIYAVVVNSVQIFNFTFPRESYPDICYSLEQIFAFWK